MKTTEKTAAEIAKMNSKERKNYLRAVAFNAAKTAMEAEQEEYAAETKTVTTDAKTRTETELRDFKTALTAKVLEMRKAGKTDTLAATLMQRELKGVSLELSRVISVRAAEQRRDVQGRKYTNAAARNLTVTEYDAQVQARKDAKAAETAKAAAQQPLPVELDRTGKHNTRNFAELRPVMNPAKPFVVVTLADVWAAVKAPNGVMKTQNYVEHGKYNTGNRFEN